MLFEILRLNDSQSGLTAPQLTAPLTTITEASDLSAGKEAKESKSARSGKEAGSSVEVGSESRVSSGVGP